MPVPRGFYIFTVQDDITMQQSSISKSSEIKFDMEDIQKFSKSPKSVRLKGMRPTQPLLVMLASGKKGVREQKSRVLEGSMATDPPPTISKCTEVTQPVNILRTPLPLQIICQKNNFCSEIPYKYDSFKLVVQFCHIKWKRSVV